jgi:hypothetical protein
LRNLSVERREKREERREKREERREKKRNGKNTKKILLQMIRLTTTTSIKIKTTHFPDGCVLKDLDIDALSCDEKASSCEIIFEDPRESVDTGISG